MLDSRPITTNYRDGVRFPAWTPISGRMKVVFQLDCKSSAFGQCGFDSYLAHHAREFQRLLTAPRRQGDRAADGATWRVRLVVSRLSFKQLSGVRFPYSLQSRNTVRKVSHAAPMDMRASRGHRITAITSALQADD